MKFSKTLLVSGILLVAAQVQSNNDTEPQPDAESSTPVQAISKADFEEVVRQQIASLRSDGDDQRVLEITTQQHFELIKKLNNAVTYLLDKVSTLETQLSALTESTTAKLSTVEAAIGGINSTVGSVSTRQQQTDQKANEALNKHNNCITDVRFGHVEVKAFWKNYGYVDTKPFVITGIHNWNRDDLGDNAMRRSF